MWFGNSTNHNKNAKVSGGVWENNSIVKKIQKPPTISFSLVPGS
jgi:hypothetical protein